MGSPMEQNGGPRYKTTKTICPLNSDKEDKNIHWIDSLFNGAGKACFLPAEEWSY